MKTKADQDRRLIEQGLGEALATVQASLNTGPEAALAALRAAQKLCEQTSRALEREMVLLEAAFPVLTTEAERTLAAIVRIGGKRRR